MCVISVCPKGTEKYSDQVISFIIRGLDNNKEGSGFMFKRDGEHKITVSKGYFDANIMINKLKEFDLQVDDELVIHHRRSTHGKITGQNCHPYVITNNLEDSLKTDIVTKKACLAHNGMFKNIDEYTSRNKDLSDTYAFARYFMTNRYIMSLFKTDKFLFKNAMAGVLHNAKLAILFPDRNLQTFGDFIEDNGYLHSNDGYCRVNNDRGGFTVNQHASHYKGYGYYEELFDDEPVDSSTFPPDDKPIVNVKRNINCTLLLHSDNLMLTESNFKHFYFIAKNDYFSPHKEDSFYCLKSWTKDAEFQLLHTPENEFDYKTVPTIRLLNSYYYIPKNTDLIQVYIDFLELKNKDETIGVKTIKNLDKMINKTKRKDGNDSIYYGKYNSTYTKTSLILYREYLLSCIPELYMRFEYEKAVNDKVN